jgi:hypothetical protein
MVVGKCVSLSEKVSTYAQEWNELNRDKLDEANY